MLTLTFQANCASWHIPGIKEVLEMVIEKWGDVWLVDVREDQKAVQEQMRIDDMTRQIPRYF